MIERLRAPRKLAVRRRAALGVQAMYSRAVCRGLCRS